MMLMGLFTKIERLLPIFGRPIENKNSYYIELAGKSAYIDVTSKFNFSDNNLNKQLNVFC